jgi:hypothetical protein
LRESDTNVIAKIDRDIRHKLEKFGLTPYFEIVNGSNRPPLNEFKCRFSKHQAFLSLHEQEMQFSKIKEHELLKKDLKLADALIRVCDQELKSKTEMNKVRLFQ